MIFVTTCRWDCVGNLPLRLHTMVLRPENAYSDTESAWTWIRYKDTGLADLRLRSKVVYELLTGHEARMFSGDGILCWFRKKEGLILFDFHEERFRRVMLPEGLEIEHEKRVFVRGLLNGLALYVLPLDGNNPACFVLDDYKDGIWRKESVEFPEDIGELKGGSAVAAGDDEMLMLMGNEESNSRVVYSYGDDKSVERFLVGKLPINKPLDLTGKCKPWDCYSNFDARLSCLHDSSVLYRSINDVLSCANVCECCGNEYENEDPVAAAS